jgi:predicted ATPase/DNA-binding CsgD family transcriptional regulator
MPTPPNNLPHQLTSFIGREREKSEVRRLLMGSRLLTLTGPGGSGKTRLALEVAREVLDLYPDGVWFVDLSPLSDPTLVPNTIASTLGVQEQPGRNVIDTLADWLKEREILLVLDNCEHLIEACAQIADHVLHACPLVHIFTTSRQSLGLLGEILWQVPTLSLPENTKAYSFDSLTQLEAVRLFAARARLRRQDFALTPNNIEVVLEVCRRLDGLPLAIELAAARVTILSVEQIRERLHQVFRLLANSSPTVSPRQRTLRAVFEWSYSLLSEPERQLLQTMSEFAGATRLENVDAVCEIENANAKTVDLLSNLIEKSLVILDGKPGEPRYRLLDTIRQFAQEKLLESNNATRVRENHTDFLVELAERAEANLNMPHQAEWLGRLEEERDNLHMILRWAVENQKYEATLRLISAIRRFFYIRGHLTEARKWLEASIRDSESIPVALHAKALYTKGLFAYYQSDTEEAKSALRQSLALYRMLSDDWGSATVLNNLGLVAFLTNDYFSAHALLSESLDLYRKQGDLRCTGLCLNNLGFIHWKQDDYNGASQLFSEAELILRQVEDQESLAWSYYGLSHVAFSQGKDASARKFAMESLSIRRELMDRRGIIDCIELLAQILVAQGQAAQATILFGAANTMRKKINVPVPTYERSDYILSVTAAQVELGQEVWQQAWQQGLEVSIEEASSLALGERSFPEFFGPTKQRRNEGDRTYQEVPKSNSISRRELEVLHLLAEGLTNEQIAERLFLSRNTVHAHLHSIYGKLDVSTRGAAIRFAVEKGLLQRA